MRGADDVGGHGGLGERPRIADVRQAREMVDARGRRGAQRRQDGVAIEQFHRHPRHPGPVVHRRGRLMPGDHGLGGRERREEVAADEPGRARDEDGRGHQ